MNVISQGNNKSHQIIQISGQLLISSTLISVAAMQLAGSQCTISRGLITYIMKITLKFIMMGNCLCLCHTLQIRRLDFVLAGYETSIYEKNFQKTSENWMSA